MNLRLYRATVRASLSRPSTTEGGAPEDLTPDLPPGIAIADWAVQYEDTAPTLRGYQVAIFGGTPAEKPEQYARSSPISYVDQVRAPVLVVQGRSDTRCPARPMQEYERRMRERLFRTRRGCRFLAEDLQDPRYAAAEEAFMASHVCRLDCIASRNQR